MKYIKKLIWRLQFKKVKFVPNPSISDGRCVKCAAGNPKIECSEYYCPCNENQQLIRKYNFKWIKF